ncbi:MAG TPA: low affinity iron permease family protein [Mesorhizobium sp.]|jgi:low affinity Fe/Cu permease|uniref:low affinity iron permease family protein n=1 Tax=Mesorhizobium sp. TaxID=1871066 RepID=UPI002DDD2A4C|nr:low affinity iron permease family protein [Mesorhizobium sp.]HEV2503725.1 low affinity iron permease family protein [Mesorhizobium sp.]
MEKVFSHFADTISRWTGKPLTFVLCAFSVVIWAVSGPLFGFSETWQLIINTGTTIVTFLMVFLIQSTQNRDGAAVQAKLDELIRAGAAKNDFIGIERLTEAEVAQFRAWCEKAKEDQPAKALDQKLIGNLDKQKPKSRIRSRKETVRSG